ncbi:hypothetical protein ACWK8F_001429, partial [Campylobacter jejuni]
KMREAILNNSFTQFKRNFYHLRSK